MLRMFWENLCNFCVLEFSLGADWFFSGKIPEERSPRSGDAEVRDFAEPSTHRAVGPSVFVFAFFFTKNR